MKDRYLLVFVFTHPHPSPSEPLEVACSSETEALSTMRSLVDHTVDHVMLRDRQIVRAKLVWSRPKHCWEG